MNRVKYFASYSGPAYGSMDQEYVEAFASLSEAMWSMRKRQNGYGVEQTTYRENSDGTHILWESNKYYATPGTTPEDYMDLYHAIPEDGGYIIGDWMYRITVGPRGGIRPEKA